MALEINTVGTTKFVNIPAGETYDFEELYTFLETINQNSINTAVANSIADSTANGLSSTVAAQNAITAEENAILFKIFQDNTFTIIDFISNTGLTMGVGSGLNIGTTVGRTSMLLISGTHNPADFTITGTITMGHSRYVHNTFFKILTNSTSEWKQATAILRGINGGTLKMLGTIFSTASALDFHSNTSFNIDLDGCIFLPFERADSQKARARVQCNTKLNNCIIQIPFNIYVAVTEFSSNRVISTGSVDFYQFARGGSLIRNRITLPNFQLIDGAEGLNGGSLDINYQDNEVFPDNIAFKTGAKYLNTEASEITNRIQGTIKSGGVGADFFISVIGAKDGNEPAGGGDFYKYTGSSISISTIASYVKADIEAIHTAENLSEYLSNMHERWELHKQCDSTGDTGVLDILLAIDYDNQDRYRHYNSALSLGLTRNFKQIGGSVKKFEIQYYSYRFENPASLNTLEINKAGVFSFEKDNLVDVNLTDSRTDVAAYTMIDTFEKLYNRMKYKQHSSSDLAFSTGNPTLLWVYYENGVLKSREGWEFEFVSVPIENNNSEPDLIDTTNKKIKIYTGAKITAETKVEFSLLEINGVGLEGEISRLTNTGTEVAPVLKRSFLYTLEVAAASKLDFNLEIVLTQIDGTKINRSLGSYKGTNIVRTEIIKEYYTNIKICLGGSEGITQAIPYAIDDLPVLSNHALYTRIIAEDLWETDFHKTTNPIDVVLESGNETLTISSAWANQTLKLQRLLWAVRECVAEYNKGKTEGRLTLTNYVEQIGDVVYFKKEFTNSTFPTINPEELTGIFFHDNNFNYLTQNVGVAAETTTRATSTLQGVANTIILIQEKGVSSTLQKTTQVNDSYTWIFDKTKTYEIRVDKLGFTAPVTEVSDANRNKNFVFVAVEGISYTAGTTDLLSETFFQLVSGNIEIQKTLALKDDEENAARQNEINILCQFYQTLGVNDAHPINKLENGLLHLNYDALLKSGIAGDVFSANQLLYNGKLITGNVRSLQAESLNLTAKIESPFQAEDRNKINYLNREVSSLRLTGKKYDATKTY